MSDCNLTDFADESSLCTDCNKSEGEISYASEFLCSQCYEEGMRDKDGE